MKLAMNAVVPKEMAEAFSFDNMVEVLDENRGYLGVYNLRGDALLRLSHITGRWCQCNHNLTGCFYKVVGRRAS